MEEDFNISALGWISSQKAKPLIERLLAEKSAFHRYIGIAAGAIHRRDPGQHLNKAARDVHPLLIARALRAYGELGRSRELDSYKPLDPRLPISACASTTPKEAIVNKTDETNHFVIEKGKFETPPALKQTATPQAVVEPAKPAQTALDAGQASAPAATRIHPKERSVNIRTSPSIKSRIAAVLKGGQPIEVLETQGNWLKIKWQKSDSVKQGWINKRFVDGFDQ